MVLHDRSLKRPAASVEAGFGCRPKSNENARAKRCDMAFSLYKSKDMTEDVTTSGQRREQYAGNRRADS